MSATNVSSTVAVYDAVRAAIGQRRSLAMAYATGGTIVKERMIRPIAIEVGKRGSDLVIARDSLRHGVATFRVDRIIAVSAGVQAGARA